MNENKKQNKLLVILASIFTGLILITTVVLWVYFDKSKVENITIPDVSIKSLVDASTYTHRRRIFSKRKVEYTLI